MDRSIRIVLFCLLCFGTIAAPLCPVQARQQPGATDVRWNVLILSPSKIYCYTTDLNAGRTAAIKAKNTFRPLLIDMKKKWGKRLRVVIKAADSSDSKTIIGVIDEITINRIAKYEMINMTAAEEKKFGQRGISTDMPNIKTRIVEDKGPAIIIQLHDSTEAGLSYMYEKGKRENLADAHGPEALAAAIDKAAARAGGKDKLHVLIRGSADVPYSGVHWVIQVLRSKKYYRYQLITTPE